MILQRLKQETYSYHEQIEKDLTLLRNNITCDAYTHILQRFWGFYCPVEIQPGMIAAWHDFDLGQRRKCVLLERDLHALGINSLPPICKDLPMLQSIAQAVGCLYVLEGATLGGQIIAKHIKRTLGLGPQNGCAFFHSYGCNVGNMWQAFGRQIIAYTSANRTEDSIVLSACETFKKLHCWLLEDGL